MTLDVTTLLVFSALVTVATSSLFLAETWSREADTVDRLWSLGFASALLTSLCYVTSEVVPELWFALALGNGLLALTPLALWNGIRVYAGRRRSLIEVSVAVALLAVLATLIRFPEGGSWSGAEVYLLGNAAGSLLSAGEILRSPAKGERAARYLVVIMSVAGVFFVLRWVLFLVLGAESDLFHAYAGTAVASLVVPLCIMGAAFSMTVLRHNQAHTRREASRNFDPMTGARTQSSFNPRAVELLRAAEEDGAPVCVVAIHPENYEEIALAFDGDVADQALVRVGEVTINMLPARAIMGRDAVDVHSFQVVLPGTTEEAVQWAQGVRTELIATPFDADGTRMRLSVRLGIASSIRHGYELCSLCNISREAAGEGTDAVAVAR
ncbi:GGDEF domain-containing protein [Georgenia alba]|uniref:GGDEF domain-containing protein n=1 Tax=Georgenia alba TaxID=2233858 RepID=A0ABW2Q629_9MICO